MRPERGKVLLKIGRLTIRRRHMAPATRDAFHLLAVWVFLPALIVLLGVATLVKIYLFRG